MLRVRRTTVSRNQPVKILLLTKSTPWCHLVQEVLRKSEHDVTVVEDLGLEYPRQHYF